MRAILADYTTALRPWLVPRRMPYLDIDGTLLRLPMAASAVPLDARSRGGDHAGERRRP